MRTWTRRWLKLPRPRRRIHSRFPLVTWTAWDQCAWLLRNRVVRRLGRVEGRLPKWARLHDRIHGGVYEGPSWPHRPSRPLIGRTLGRWRLATMGYWANLYSVAD